jgi:hypothetical protein
MNADPLHTASAAALPPSLRVPPAEYPGRCFVTLVFADLSRSTELAALMEADHYAALLSALRSAYDEIVRHLIPRDPGSYPEGRGWDFHRDIALHTPDDQPYPLL